MTDDFRDRLKRLGIAPERLPARCFSPTVPDEELLAAAADLHNSMGADVEKAYELFRRHKAERELSKRPRVVQGGATHVEPPRPRNPFTDAAARLRKPNNGGGDLPPAA